MMRRLITAMMVLGAAAAAYAQPAGDARVARILYQEAQRFRANGKVHLALFEAAVTESGMRNLRYGHLDSLGVLQIRWRLHGYETATNPSLSARWFLRQAVRIQHRYWSAGALAQAVQRSAFPDRYSRNVRWAVAWLRWVGYRGWLP